MSRVFCFLAACISLAIAVDDDQADLLADLKGMSDGLPCKWQYPWGCQCNMPEHCEEESIYKDPGSGCGGNYCFCSKCKDGYKLQDSECGSHGQPDQCVPQDNEPLPEPTSSLSPDDTITCEEGVGCYVICDGVDKDCTDDEMSGMPEVCQHANCEGKVVDGSKATEIVVECKGDAPATCAGITVKCGNDPDQGRAGCMANCLGEGACDGMEMLNTAGGYVRQWKALCRDGGCKDIKFKSSGDGEVDTFLVTAADGFEFDADGTQFNKFVHDCEMADDDNDTCPPGKLVLRNGAKIDQFFLAHGSESMAIETDDDCSD